MTELSSHATLRAFDLAFLGRSAPLEAVVTNHIELVDDVIGIFCLFDLKFIVGKRAVDNYDRLTLFRLEASDGCDLILRSEMTDSFLKAFERALRDRGIISSGFTGRGIAPC